VIEYSVIVCDEVMDATEGHPPNSTYQRLAFRGLGHPARPFVLTDRLCCGDSDMPSTRISQMIAPERDANVRFDYVSEGFDEPGGAADGRGDG
jgi:hypothetical protein